MNIAYIAPKKIPSREANSVHIMKMCNAFASHGNNITLIIPEDSKSRWYGGSVFDYYGIKESFSIVRICSTLLRIPRIRAIAYAYKAAQHIKRTGFDCIYSRDIFTCFFLAAFYRKTFVLEVHDLTQAESVKSKILQYLINKNCLSKLVVITDALKRDIIKRYALNSNMLFVAPDGADPPGEAASNVSLVTTSEGKYHIGYTGHLYKGRGIELLGDMATALPFAFFHIIGGTEEDIAYWKDIYKNIDNICFYGYVPPSQTACYGKLMDVLIAPYQNYLVTSNGVNTVGCMSPLKIFEYMALGKPIICSDMSVLREVLTDGVNSVLCPPDSVEAWVAAIEMLHEDKEFANNIAGNALKDFNEKYTWSARAEKILEHITSPV